MEERERGRWRVDESGEELEEEERRRECKKELSARSHCI